MNKGKILIGTCAALAAVYLGGAVFFNSHVMPGTTLNGMDASCMEKSQVCTQLNEELAAYKITVTERDFTEELADLGLSFDENEIAKALEANCFTWPAALFNPAEKTVDFKYDRKAIEEKINSLKCLAAPESPVDAELEYKDGHYEIKAETYGYEPANADSTREKVLKAVLSLEEGTDLTEDFKNPEVKSDYAPLLSVAEEVQSYMDLGIYYEFGSSKEELTNDIMQTFFTIDDYQLEIDHDAVKAYVQSLADEYDTCYTQRYFKTHSGKTITIKKGDYGWWTNTADSTEALIEKIQAKEGGKAEIVYRQTAASYDGDDYGGTYVEVSISAQTLWLYKDGKCILSTPVTTGNPNKGNGTPKGIYAITYKTREHRMVGEDYDVEVEYWMPFCGNVGLHDATWRSKFGSNYYLTSGSHGCVNIPLSATKKIYNTVKKFTAVIVY